MKPNDGSHTTEDQWSILWCHNARKTLTVYYSLKHLVLKNNTCPFICLHQQNILSQDNFQKILCDRTKFQKNKKTNKQTKNTKNKTKQKNLINISMENVKAGIYGVWHLKSATQWKREKIGKREVILSFQWSVRLHIFVLIPIYAKVKWFHLTF